MASGTKVVCPGLASRTSFKSYISAVDDITNGSFQLPPACQAEVCNALYGFGNADIHGIGALIGYLLANVLGFVFAFLHWYYRSKIRQDRPPKCFWILTTGYKSFFNCALLLGLSIQIAATIVLARLDFGLSAAGVGATTAKITWTVSIITLLPLTYGIFMPRLHRAMEGKHVPDEKAQGDLSSIARADASGPQSQVSGNSVDEDIRFDVFVLCWILSLWVFITKMAQLFGRSQVSNSSSAVVSPEDFQSITKPCFDHVRNLTATEEALMNTFGIGIPLFISVLTIWKIVSRGILNRHPDSSSPKEVGHLSTSNERTSRLVETMMVFGLPLLAVTQAWTILRLRQLQQDMAQSAGGQDDDDVLGFGQVIAVTLFVPVGIDLWSACKTRQTQRRLEPQAS